MHARTGEIQTFSHPNIYVLVGNRETRIGNANKQWGEQKMDIFRKGFHLTRMGRTFKKLDFRVISPIS